MEIKKKLDQLRNNVINETRSYPLLYLILAIILIFALFLRVYRLTDLLGFYYDQGRDALVVWRLWNEGKLFLIGPVTGLSGIFLGPFYYYLIAPFYLIGQGNPVYPSVFLAFTTVAASLTLYVVGIKMHSRAAGLIATAIGGFSYYFVLAGRWLSNPTPIFLTSVLLLWSMHELVLSRQKEITKKRNLWLLVSLLIGISMQFESASAVFYIPMILVFAIWQRKSLPDKKTLVLSLIIFALTLVPQIIFNFRHNNILFDNFKRVLFEERSFRSPFSPENLQTKIDYFRTVFTSKIFPLPYMFSFVFYFFSLFGLWKLFSENRREITLLSIFLGIPMVGYIFFQGNHGNIYDYYVSGYYFPMILLFSLGLSYFWNKKAGKLLVIIFVIVFLNMNLGLARKYLTTPIGGPDGVGLGNELQAVNWIFNDAKRVDKFNVDVYVPPVIPHSYDYLFLWQGNEKCGKEQCGLTKDENVGTLYTLYETDVQHPDRLEVWLDRQNTIGKVIVEESFAAITVQKRQRFEF